MRVVLQITSGPAAGRKLWLHENQSQTVGRTSKAGFTISEDRRISALHFHLHCDIRRCTIRDNNSTNGTFVNDQRVKTARLNDGDTVKAGLTEFAVSVEGAVPDDFGDIERDYEAPSRQFVDWHLAQYERYLDEAGALYTQRMSLLDDPEVSWLDVGDCEHRLEAHIDGLAVGAELAVGVCQERLDTADEGTVYAATRVILRQHRRDLFDQLVATTSPDDVARLSEVAHAVQDGFPREWNGLVSHDLTDGGPQMTLALLRIIALRRVPAGTALLELLDRCSEERLPEVIRTMGILGDFRVHDRLFSLLCNSASDRIKSIASIALLNLGAEHVIDKCMRQVEEKDWPLLTLGYGGGMETVDLLIRRVQDKPHTDGLLALGLLGGKRAVNVLWQTLSDEKYAATAAVALYLITGAELFDEEPESEVEEQGEARGDDATVVMPPSSETPKLEALTQSQSRWKQWWQRNHERFRNDKRYRLGQLYTPKVLVSILMSEQTPARLRAIVLDELMIRYNLECPFSTDLSVVDQQRFLAKINEWSVTYGCRFEPGRWYFDGCLSRS